MKYPIMADAPRWYLDKEMTKKCKIPTAPNVPYWVVVQREDSDVSALQGLIDIIDDEDEAEQEEEEYEEEYEDEGYDDEFEDEGYVEEQV